MPAAPSPPPIQSVTGFLFIHPEMDPAILASQPLYIRRLSLVVQISQFSVVLIKKSRPDYLAGKLTGPGGKIDEALGDTSPKRALVREWHEETGMWFDDWTQVLTMGTAHNTLVHYLVGFAPPDRLASLRTMTDEPVYVVKLYEIMQGFHNGTDNLQWQLMMALEVAAGRAFRYEVSEGGFGHGFGNDNDEIPF